MKHYMNTYYVIYFRELIPCYLIKEGYIPCRDYRVDKNDFYYGAYSREAFCIRYSSDKEDIFEDKKQAIKVLKNKTEQKFNRDLRYLIEDREYYLKRLLEIKK